jgi:hypothetical protein
MPEVKYPTDNYPKASIFVEDEQAYVLWWVGGGPEDAWNIHLRLWITLGGVWNCEIRFGRSHRLYDVVVIPDLRTI